MFEIFAVGIGPGDEEHLTGEARRVLAECDCVAGYRPYLELIRPLLAGKRLIAGSMREEVARGRAALEAVLEGARVAVVSSGDAGVYGMAGLLLELTGEARYAGIRVTVVPGVTAAQSCAALVGAPLMNDFMVLSLSDLMTPAEQIRKRLVAAAELDLPVALYNPASSRRRELLEFAVRTFLAGGKNPPFALVRDAYRAGQRIVLGRLEEFPLADVQMTTLVLIGNSQCILRDGRMFCPRGYREKYDVGG